MFCAPTAIFERAIARIRLKPSKHAAVPTPSYEEQLLPLEMQDLRAALNHAKASEETALRIIERYSIIREKLQQYANEAHQRKALEFQKERWPSASITLPPPPQLPRLDIPLGLPGEFSDYLEGAISWHNAADAEKTIARNAWERLLKRPLPERRWKSVWAAFMLGKYWARSDADEALAYFQKVRALTTGGCFDSVGLAAARLGLEAQVQLNRKHYEPAIQLYFEQLAAGDPSATNSLRFAAAIALGDAEADLIPLARNPRIQRLLTSYLISCSNPGISSSQPTIILERVHRWLLAVEAADVTDLESAETLSLAAYKANEMDLARRWIKRAGNSPFCRWIEAKLLLHDGKVNSAAKLLSEACRAFPLIPPDPHSANTSWFEDSLVMEEENGCSIAQAAHGELGVLKLARREYTLSLDCLLRAGFWRDAAYVAERVLTIPELKTYVDEFWPLVSDEDAAAENEVFGAVSYSPVSLRTNIRYLLARRLFRSGDLAAARDYYPSEWLPQFDALKGALDWGDSECLPPETRANSWLRAAFITRTNGLELLGTELAPDWKVYDGNFEGNLPVFRGRADSKSYFNIPSRDELERVENHKPDPDLRWHYRYHAAALCWDAAALLPDNTDQTALLLWQGGWWLRYTDLDTADAFYKSLVLRNPDTELGAEADRRRWFPKLDENGRVIPNPSRPAKLTERGED